MNKPNQLNEKPWAQNRTSFDRNLAVVIGIDRYEDENIHDLSTPVSDTNAFADLSWKQNTNIKLKMSCA
jgi:hypothetical protein